MHTDTGNRGRGIYVEGIGEESVRFVEIVRARRA